MHFLQIGPNCLTNYLGLAPAIQGELFLDHLSSKQIYRLV